MDDYLQNKQNKIMGPKTNKINFLYNFKEQPSTVTSRQSDQTQQTEIYGKLKKKSALIGCDTVVI